MRELLEETGVSSAELLHEVSASAQVDVSGPLA